MLLQAWLPLPYDILLIIQDLTKDTIKERGEKLLALDCGLLKCIFFRERLTWFFPYLEYDDTTGDSEEQPFAYWPARNHFNLLNVECKKRCLCTNENYKHPNHKFFNRYFNKV